MRSWAACGVLGLLAATLGLACTGSPGDAAGKPAPSTHTITIEAVSYAPAALTVNVGDRIVWVNKDPFPHTATSPAAGFDSKEIGADAGSWTFTTQHAGDFPYVCTLHPTMKGVLHVRQPGTTAPPER